MAKILRQRHETPLQMLVRLAPDDFMGVTFGSKGQLRAGNRTSRYAGIVTGGVGPETDPVAAAVKYPLGKVCPSCNVEMAKRQTDCC